MAREQKISIAIIGKTKQFTDDLTKVQKRLQGLGSFAGKAGKAGKAGVGKIGTARIRYCNSSRCSFR